jgi:hypothetical protein
MGLRFFSPSVRFGIGLVVLLGVSSGVCRAPQTPPEPSRAERVRLATNYIHQKLPFWQQRLQLKDWKIAVLTAHPTDLRQRTLGNVHWDMDKKTAVIRVMDAADYQTPFRDTLDDMEFTIVHEMIHLELASLPRSEASRSDEEYAINHLADALLQFDRKDRPVVPVIQPDPSVTH